MSLKDYWYEHPVAKKALGDLQCYLDLKMQGHITLLIAPSRVGKTTLLEHIAKGYRAEGKKVLTVKAAKSGANGFSWRPIQRLHLELLGYPFYQDLKGEDIDSTWHLIFDYLMQEKVDLLIWDDSDFISSAKSDRARLHVAEHLKALAEHCPAQLIISGTHHLHSLVKEEGQILNRSDIAYMRPYRFDGERSGSRDLKALVRCLHNFNENMDIKLSDAVLAQPSELFKGCFGCIGGLSERLRIAEAFAKRSNKGVVSFFHIRKAFRNYDSEGTINDEIMHFKNMVEGELE